MAKHAEVRPRGHFAKKLGVEVRLVQVDAEVWEAFDGDPEAIREALRTVAALVRSRKAARRKKTA